MNGYLDLNYLKFSKELKDKIVNDADFCKSVAKCGTLESCRAYLDVLLDFYMESLSVCNKGSNTQALADSKILLQMMFVKGMNLRRMLEPLGYLAPRIRINPIIDQVSVNSMVRDIFELFCAFELVYILPEIGRASCRERV